MRRSRHSDEQIAYPLRQAESGTAGAYACPQLGISEATHYLWNKRYGRVGINQVHELRQLRKEDARLKRLAVYLSLDDRILGGSVRKNCSCTTGAVGVPAGPHCARGFANSPRHGRALAHRAV